MENTVRAGSAFAGFGLIAALLQMSGIAAALFGHDVIFPMLGPLGLSQLILAVWLITKGFRGSERRDVS